MSAFYHLCPFFFQPFVHRQARLLASATQYQLLCSKHPLAQWLPNQAGVQHTWHTGSPGYAQLHRVKKNPKQYAHQLII